jgi:hypothetical protein
VLTGATDSSFPVPAIGGTEQYQAARAAYRDAIILRLAESFQFFLPFLQSDGSNFTGIAVSNSAASDANLELRAYGPSGNLLPLPNAPARIALPARTQLAKVSQQIFGGDPAQSGWVELTTDSAVSTFFQLGDASRLDGALAWGRTASRFFFTRVFEGPSAFFGQAARTFISIANPGDEPSTVRLELYAPPGRSLVAGKVRGIPAKGLLYGSVSDLFDQSLSVSSGYIECTVMDGDGLVGFESIQLLDRATVIGLSAATESAQTRSYSAQLASLPSLFTNVKLINVADQGRVVRLSAINENGGELAGAVTVTLGPGEVLERDAGELFQLPAGAESIGSLSIEADGVGVQGDVVFGDRNSFNYAAAMALQTRTLVESVFSQVANNDVFWTGLALYNPGSSDSEVTIEVYSAAGTKTAATTTPLVLGRGKRLSKLLTQLLPATAGQVGGYILLRSTRPIVAQQLFGDNSFNFLSAVPPAIIR